MNLKHVFEENFNSIHHLLTVIEGRKNNPEMSDERSSETNGKNFTGTNSYKQAVFLFENGYTDVLPQIKGGIQKNMKATQNSTRRMVRTGVVGYAPHVPNAILGLPNSMIYSDKQTQKIKAVTIYYAPTENCGTSTETFIKSGIAMLSAINILELSGVRVSLNIVFFNGVNDDETEGSFATVKVKDFREQMDIQKLCFPVVHPSLFRRFGFKWVETTPDMKESGWRCGYGHHSAKFDEILKSKLKDNEFFIGLSDTKKAEYSPETLINNLGIKK